MSATSILKGNTQSHPTRRRHASFAVGQAVWMKNGSGMSASTFRNTYRITGTLPARGGALQYRIRNDDEPHERVMAEDKLELVRASSAGDRATLIEKTFGHDRSSRFR